MLIRKDFMEETNIIQLNNKPDLKLVTGGKEPTGHSDFLSNLKQGTHFLVKDKTTASLDFLEVRKQWQRMDFKERPCYLDTMIVTPTGNTAIGMWVNPARWCNKYELVGILWEPSEEPQEPSEE